MRPGPRRRRPRGAEGGARRYSWSLPGGRPGRHRHRREWGERLGIWPLGTPGGPRAALTVGGRQGQRRWRAELRARRPLPSQAHSSRSSSGGGCSGGGTAATPTPESAAAAVAAAPLPLRSPLPLRPGPRPRPRRRLLIGRAGHGVAPAALEGR